MSTLNSYFRARKSRNTSINKEKTNAFTEGEKKQQFAAQVPQPIYETVPKQRAIINTGKKTIAAKRHLQDNARNSILHYLSPVKKTTHTTEEDAPLCQIRHNIPVTHVWNVILEEFDPQSQPNQFECSPSPSPTIEKAELCTINDMLMNNNRRRKLEQGMHHTSRCVRIRTVGPSTPSIDIFCIEDYLWEDPNEDLSRPVRNKCTLTESNNFYKDMLEALLYSE